MARCAVLERFSRAVICKKLPTVTFVTLVGCSHASELPSLFGGCNFFAPLSAVAPDLWAWVEWLRQFGA